MTRKRQIELRIEAKKARLSLYYEAEEAVLAGAQSYQIGSRQLTRASLPEIRKAIKLLEDEIAELEAAAGGGSRRRMVSIVPRDV